MKMIKKAEEEKKREEKKKNKQAPVGKLTDLRILGAYDLTLNPQNKPISSLEAQKIRSSERKFPEHHDLVWKCLVLFQSLVRDLC